VKYSGKPCRLTPEQVAQLKARYYLYQSNSPARIAEDLGISVATLHNYLHDKHKIGTERRAAQGLADVAR
jgi:DNA-binding CsgD family transcriptional regulator